MNPILPYELPSSIFLPYNPEVMGAVDVLRALLLSHMPNVGIEHIGSTAVEGMPGKNSINILVVTELDNFKPVLGKLKELGFHDHPFKKEPADRPFVVGAIKSVDSLHPLHVHVVEKDSANHLDPLFFREYLREHPEVAGQYAELKKALADRNLISAEYNAAKQPFIRDILAKRTQ